MKPLTFVLQQIQNRNCFEMHINICVQANCIDMFKKIKKYAIVIK